MAVGARMPPGDEDRARADREARFGAGYAQRLCQELAEEPVARLLRRREPRGVGLDVGDEARELRVRGLGLGSCAIGVASPPSASYQSTMPRSGSGLGSAKSAACASPRVRRR